SSLLMFVGMRGMNLIVERHPNGLLALRSSSVQGAGDGLALVVTALYSRSGMNSSRVGLPSPYPSPGEVIDGKYQIDKILGEGGMGCVARAYHTILRKAVAVKFMNPMFMSIDGAVQRFINEGVASGRIKSDHVVPVNESGKLPSGAPYLVMECLHGLD